MSNKIHREVFLKASIDKVFSVVRKAKEMADMWPGLLEVNNIVELPNGGESFDFVYMLAGMRLKGHSEDQELEPPTYISNITISGVESRQFWELEWDEREQGVKATFEVEYKVPIPILHRFAEHLVAAFTEVDVDAMIKNVKYRVEKA